MITWAYYPCLSISIKELPDLKIYTLLSQIKLYTSIVEHRQVVPSIFFAIQMTTQVLQLVHMLFLCWDLIGVLTDHIQIPVYLEVFYSIHTVGRRLNHKPVTGD